MKTVCMLGCVMGVHGKQASEMISEGSSNSEHLSTCGGGAADRKCG